MSVSASELPGASDKGQGEFISIEDKVHNIIIFAEPDPLLQSHNLLKCYIVKTKAYRIFADVANTFLSAFTRRLRYCLIIFTLKTQFILAPNMHSAFCIMHIHTEL